MKILTRVLIPPCWPVRIIHCKWEWLLMRLMVLWFASLRPLLHSSLFLNTVFLDLPHHHVALWVQSVQIMKISIEVDCPCKLIPLDPPYEFVIIHANTILTVVLIPPKGTVWVVVAINDDSYWGRSPFRCGTFRLVPLEFVFIPEQYSNSGVDPTRIGC